MADVTVVTTAVRAESGKWTRLSDDVAEAKKAVQRLGLDPSAFFIGGTETILHSRAYDDFQAFMGGVLAGAEVEFDQIAMALRRVADAYDDADKVVELNLDKIYHA